MSVKITNLIENSPGENPALKNEHANDLSTYLNNNFNNGSSLLKLWL